MKHPYTTPPKAAVAWVVIAVYFAVLFLGLYAVGELIAFLFLVVL